MVYRIAEQVVEAVRHLHELRICHRDPMLDGLGVLLKLGCEISHNRCPTQLLRAAGTGVWTRSMDSPNLACCRLGDWLGATGVSWTCRGEVVDAQLTFEATRELLRTEFNRAVCHRRPSH